jgi:conjugative relaxase-like TrwC/TraI family protein
VLTGPLGRFGGLVRSVLSIGKLAVGQADYYLNQAKGRIARVASVASGVDDYYIGGPEAAGEWLGGLTGAVGLRGSVDGDALVHVLAGRSPADGEPLTRRPTQVPGFDVTFSAPKSVSVLFGVGEEAVRDAIRDAHDAAVRDAFGYVERHAAYSRRGHGGHELIAGEGLIAAAFRHRTSRAGDPQLHTHVLVANLTRCVDGRWRAIDARRLYAHGKTASYLYEARLRAELSRRLGVTWTQPENGIADVEGVPREVLRAFSRRRAEIEQALARVGRNSAAAAQVAALETRRRKDHGVSAEQLVGEWRSRAASLRFDADAMRNVVGRQPEPAALGTDAIARLRAQLASPEGVTRDQSTVTRRDVIQAWCAQMHPGTDVTAREIEVHVDELLRSQAFVTLLDANDKGAAIRLRDGRLVAALPDDRRYTTPELLAVEHRIIAVATAPAAAPTANAAATDEALDARPLLSAEQVEMVRGLTADAGRISVVVGKAGTGKTYALEAARAAWEAAGVRVMGAAVARRAARELEEGSGIVSTSVAALVADVRGGYLLPRRSVLVVDEASLLPTRQLGELLEHVVTADAKLVLVGDHRQLPAIQAGGAFFGLARRLGALELHENRRQAEAWEREALDLLREGQAAAALEAYAVNDRLVVGEHAAAVGDALVADWWHDGDEGDALMIAFRRADVALLNERARALMRAAGRLGSTQLDVDGRRFAAGDRVVLRRNDSRRGVANGDRAIVLAVDGGSRCLDVELQGRRVRLDDAYLSPRWGRPGLAHGYAVTGHVAQGMTVDRALVLGTDALFQEWGYVAMSRGRLVNRFYAVAGSPERNEFAPAERHRTAIDDIARALERSRAELMATDTGWWQQLRTERDGDLDERARALRREGAADAVASIRELRRLRAAGADLVAATPAERSLVAGRAADFRAMTANAEERLSEADIDAVARLRCVEQELERRERLAASGRRLVAPPAMLEAIGPRPERPAELDRWRRRVADTGRSAVSERLRVR